MTIQISHEGLDITISYEPNEDQDNDNSINKNPTEGNIVPGIPSPLTKRDKKVMDETWEYLEYLADRGLI